MVNEFRDDNLHPVIQQVYAGRRVTTTADLDYRLEHLTTPERLPGLAAAVAVLMESLRQNKSILFIGDFDADGATSTALGMLALRSMGAARVDYLVPNRFEYGYGLSPEIVEVAARRQPDVLVTVDNGVSSIEGVAAAKRYGMSVVITDHHLPGETLPAADAIVNPNLSGSGFASKALAGVGVIYYVMIALRAALREQGWFANRVVPRLGDYLDLVAVGTVADLVPLDRNNRIMVRKGLQRINSRQCRPGIRALLQHSNVQVGEAGASDLGFVVAPRLNAAGRLQDMSLGIECLLAEDDVSARRIAGELDLLNGQRRRIEAGMQSEALQIVEHMQLNGSLGAGLCLYDESWHEGIVGLIAGRVKDRLSRPVVAFAKSGPDELKGSARSVTGVHIRDVLNGIETKLPGLITRFGGHATAAGLSLQERRLGAFREAFSSEVKAHLEGNDELGVIYTDGGLEEQDICVEFARLLREAGPWGQGFPEPEFDDVFDVLDKRGVGDGGRHLKLRVRKKNSKQVLDAIAFFQGADHLATDMSSGVRLVYKLDVNEYNGVRKPQLVVQYLEGRAPA